METAQVEEKPEKTDEKKRREKRAAPISARFARKTLSTELSRIRKDETKSMGKKKNQERFFKDPFARQPYQHLRSGSLSVSKEQHETHMRKTYFDPILIQIEKYLKANLKISCGQLLPEKN